ncbi:xanthine dehydrogenase accessory protein XdhC [Xaviernesmea oryzae]|uniref:Xanthine dehydrogenase accessory protein XdhC n=1 Tax=Xaviernesmea oryzae TaxID=464029 RepID=A0A1Q9AVM4_9HYPH|nr:xanthine dehydrogenase accessory protein XdhC [Xaviernesmea oryzae]OLP59448.1 xanthine dehydrogenase accessory protein XdhC [Xaviernesmea oryzae]SEL59613.1 xanthine dehydrogenase accessory factor [Xaviernesmea oryzae]
MDGLAAFLDAEPALVLVEIVNVKGSAPRETDAFMLVGPRALFGTIGGGQLEYLAIDEARRLLTSGDGPLLRDVPLGPAIGQCCGGRVSLRLSRLDETARAAFLAGKVAEAEAWPRILLFGAGHVGKALAQALAPLPLRLCVIESRAEELDSLPSGIDRRLTPLPEAEIDAADAGSVILILTHDHALDFLIAARALARGDFAYVGMIGSATKRASFRRYAREEGLSPSQSDRLTLPIGGSAVRDKRPAVIAALTAAEILTVLAQAPANATLGAR